MTSKLPPRSTTATISSVHPRNALPNPSQASNPLTNTAVRATETFRRRRSGFWAVGIAIIVGSGAIFGAQLSEIQQNTERQNKQEQKLMEESHADKTDIKDSTTIANKPTAHPTIAPVENDTRGASANQRQISFLEDRRGVLMKQKFDLEKKLERVRERKRRDEMIEGRRSIGVGSER